jgi:hypothetical protein
MKAERQLMLKRMFMKPESIWYLFQFLTIVYMKKTTLSPLDLNIFVSNNGMIKYQKEFSFATEAALIV